MPLTDKDRERIASRLTERGVKGCPVCGHPGWTLSQYYAPLIVYKDFKHYSRSASFIEPCIALLCTKCGNTNLFNLIQLGLQDISDKDAPDHPKSPKYGKD